MTVILLSMLVLILFSMILKKSKILTLITIIFMWCLATFTYGNADETIYMSRYLDIGFWENDTEYLFMLLIKVCRFFNLNFIEYKGVVFAIILLLVSLTVWKLCNYPNVALVIFLFYPFFMYISQIRNALATSVFIFGYRYLLADKKENLDSNKVFIDRDDLFFISCIVVATLIHTASFIWLLLLIPKKLNLKFNIIISILMNLFIIVSSNISSIAQLVISKFGAQTRMEGYLSGAYQLSNYRNYGTIMPIAVSIIIFMILYLILWKTTHSDKAILGIKINLILSVCISLILRYSSEFYRLYEGSMLLNTIIILNLIPKGEFLKLKTKIPYFITECLVTLPTIYFIYFFVPGIYNTVVFPVFYQNYLFQIFN